MQNSLYEQLEKAGSDLQPGKNEYKINKIF